MLSIYPLAFAYLLKTLRAFPISLRCIKRLNFIRSLHSFCSLIQFKRIITAKHRCYWQRRCNFSFRIDMQRVSCEICCKVVLGWVMLMKKKAFLYQCKLRLWLIRFTPQFLLSFSKLSSFVDVVIPRCVISL